MLMKVYVIHPMISSIEQLLKFLHMENTFDLTWDMEAPELLMASEWIYFKKEYFEQFKLLTATAKIRVFLALEAMSPDWNLFDYAIGYDNHLTNGDRFIRLISPFDFFNSFVSTRENSITTLEQAKVELSRKTGFCNFLYSNSHAHPMRDKLFYAISEYKRVDSLGKHLNNVGQMGTGFAGHSMECVPLKSRYKFSIASENAEYAGYTSEKLLTSLEAHTVPIYFGNPDISEDINPKAFINASDFRTMDELVDYVRKVDEDDDLWCQYVLQPWMLEDQMEHHEKRNVDYNQKVISLLSGGGKRRLPQGTHVSNYRNAVLYRNYCMDIYRPTLKTRIKMFLRKMHLIR